MITHELCRDEMGAWLDGELSRGRAAEVRAHLEACAACSDHLAQLRLVSQEVRGLPRETMPADLRAGILRAARRAPDAPRRALWTFAASSLSVTAGAAALVLIVVVLRQNEPGLPQPARSVEQERAADLDDGKLALNRQAAVFPEKKADEGFSSGDAKEAAEPAPAAPPAAIAGSIGKVLMDDRAGAEESRRDAPRRSEAAAEAPQKSAGPQGSAGPQEAAGLQKSAGMPAQDDELERQEKAAPVHDSEAAHYAQASHYAAVMLESPGALVLVSGPVPIPTDSLSASRSNEADKNAGLKSKEDQASGLRKRSAQASPAAPTSAMARAAQEAPGLDAPVQRVQVLVQVDAQGVIREVEPVDPPSLDAARAARIRSLLAGRTLSGLLPGAETAILELTIRTAP
jgi:anti-sigma factor RsiW